MPVYRVKITTEQTFLWGGDAVKAASPDSLLLYFRVDDHGEPIAFGQLKNPDGELDLGELKPGQSFALPLGSLAGVYARCLTPNADSFMECTVLNRR